jgi:hypothetical protein
LFFNISDVEKQDQTPDRETLTVDREWTLTKYGDGRRANAKIERQRPECAAGRGHSHCLGISQGRVRPAPGGSEVVQ